MKIVQVLLLLMLFTKTAQSSSFETDYAISLNNYYGYTDYAKPYNKIHKQNNINSSINLYSSISYHHNKEYTTSIIGYLMVDTAKKIENYNQGIWGEEFYLLSETPYGDFSFGQSYNVAYDFAVGAPNIGGWRINNSDIVNFITNPNWYQKGSNISYKTLNSTYINTDGASLKVNYKTPVFAGIQLGATFVPQTYSRTGLVSKNAGYKDKSAYILGAYGFWDVSGYELETSLGFADYNKNDKEYSAGISIYRKGWTVGGSYRKTEVNKNDYALSKENLYDHYRDGRSYNLGVSYDIGPITTGFSYFDSKAKNSSNHDKIISFSNSYQYNKYTTLSVTTAYLKSKGENSEITNNSKGYVFIFGMELEI